MNIVIDTTDFISALIGKKHRDKLYQVLSNPEIEVFACNRLIGEIRGVGLREKFRKYVSVEVLEEYLEIVMYRVTMIQPNIQIFDCPDPDDNYLLELAVFSKSDYLLTGDKRHLLALDPYRGIRILRLSDLIDLINDTTS